jgi:hypothetical protein
MSLLRTGTPQRLCIGNSFCFVAWAPGSSCKQGRGMDARTGMRKPAVKGVFGEYRVEMGTS